MNKVITPKQRKLLDQLTKMSNIISNEVWVAENTDIDVDECIDMCIWLAKHFTEEIDKIKATE